MRVVKQGEAAVQDVNREHQPRASRGGGVRNLGSALVKAMSAELGTRARKVPQGGLVTSPGRKEAKALERRRLGIGRRLGPADLKAISDTAVGMAIVKSALKGVLMHATWNVVPDLDAESAELDQWEQTIMQRLGGKRVIVPFEPEFLHPEWRDIIEQHLPGIENLQPTVGYKRITHVFAAVRQAMERRAEEHCHEVEKLIERPNDDLEPTWTQLVALVAEDLLVIDAGVIALNRNILGDRVAELYYIPGPEVKRWARTDRSVPDPPETAYTWHRQGLEPAEFTKQELIYIVRQPQMDGYGRSPVEMCVSTIMASLSGDQYQLEMLQESNIPPAVIELGDVTDPQRETFQAQWEETLRRAGRGRAIFTNFTPNIDEAGGMKIHELRVRTPDEMGMDTFRMWTLRIMAACANLSPQDIGFVEDFHKTTAEVQFRLSRTRGFGSWLTLLETAVNTGLVKTQYPYDDVRFAYDIMDEQEEREKRGDDRADMESGIYSINEVRTRRGERPIVGGDIHYKTTPMGLVPLETAAGAVMAQRTGAGQAPPPGGPAGAAGGAPPEGPGMAEEANIVQPGEHVMGMSPQDEGIIQPTIGNPWLQMLAPTADMRKLSTLPAEVVDLVQRHGAAIYKAIEDGNDEDAKTLVQRLLYRLQRDAETAGARAPEIDGTRIVDTYAELIDALGQEMLTIADEVTEPELAAKAARRYATAEGEEVVDWITVRGQRIPVVAQTQQAPGTEHAYEGKYQPPSGYQPTYIYGNEWKSARAQEKFERAERVGENLDAMAEDITRLLQAEPASPEQQLGAALALMVHARMRVGSGSPKAEEAGTVGASTLRAGHVRAETDAVEIDYPAKGGVQMQRSLVDPLVAQAVRDCKQAAADDEARIFPEVKYKDVLDWCKRYEVKPKDFRTWHANKLFMEEAHQAMHLTLGGTEQEKKRAVAAEVGEIIKRVAVQLGHTPGVCKRSYINSALLEAYEEARLEREAA